MYSMAKEDCSSDAAMKEGASIALPHVSRFELPPHQVITISYPT